MAADDVDAWRAPPRGGRAGNRRRGILVVAGRSLLATVGGGLYRIVPRELLRLGRAGTVDLLARCGCVRQSEPWRCSSSPCRPEGPGGGVLPRRSLVSTVVDFTDVSTAGLESSPVADALAGLRANEARYFKNKYGHDFAVDPASRAKRTIAYVSRILKDERDIVIASPPLEASMFEVEGVRWAYVFYESGLSINVLYDLAAGGKRAVGFKLSDGMEVPEELADRFTFARQRSKLAGTIRGSYFVIKGEY
jgi:hypothetical protein